MRTRRGISATIAASVGALVLVLIFAGAVQAQTIDDIRVEGNERIEADTVRSYLSVTPGDTLDARAINKSLKSLFATGLFADVTIRREGGVLLIRVVENPIINRVAFEGNNRIDDETLEAEIQLRPRVVYTRTRVQSDVQRMIEIYRRSGRFAAKIEPKVIQLPQNRVDLAFEIEEGPLTGIRRISFVGNRRFSDGALRAQIRTVETAWYRFFTNDDTYDPDRLTFDRELLRKFYLSKGYADFRVLSAIAELTDDRKDFFVTFSLEEGERYQFGEIDVDSRLRDLQSEELAPLATTLPDEWYDAYEIENTIQELTDAVGSKGYAFVDIRPRVKRDRENRRIDVTYQIEEGPRIYVERIDIVGNVRTLDEVIRREFRLVEGDAFNSAKIRRSQQGIRNLSFFEKVEVDTAQGSGPDRSILTVEVAEQSTGELSFGAGFSTLDGPLGDISISERNLMGRGQSLRLGLVISARRQEIDLSFTEPYFLKKDVSAGFDVFRRTVDLQDESSFDQDTLGFRLRTGYPVTQNLRHNLNYELRSDDISNVDADASRFIKEQEGETITSSVGQSFIYDVRDSRIEPTEGYLVRVGQEVAGLGGDVRFLQHSFSFSYFYPLFDGWVLNGSTREGYIFGLADDVRITDRFFLGGASLRGFEPAGVGPRDLITDDSLGGNLFYSGTAEVTFPIDISRDVDLRGAIFTDVGSLSIVDDDGAEIFDDGSPRVSAGVGLAYRSPFGPIRIDLAQALVKEDVDKTEIFRFSFGTRF